MSKRTTRRQLVAFAVVAIAVMAYGTVRYLGVGSLLNPPYRVEAEFARAGGIYEGAEVTLTGVRIGRVGEIRPGPGAGTTVVLDIDAGTRVPADVSAAVRNGSAIGEQYLELTPNAGEGELADGDVIPVDRTSAPVDTGTLLQRVDALVSSIPPDSLATVMGELSTALEGRGDDLGSIISSADSVSARLVDDVDDISRLIDSAGTVLRTQNDLGPRTRESLSALADFTGQLDTDRDQVAALFDTGTSAAAQVQALIGDNRAVLLGLTSGLLTLSDVVARHNLGIRKFLIGFPWVLEYSATAARRCSEYDAATGRPIEATCRYDAQGRPIYSGYLGLQLPELPGTRPYFPCTQGYEGTTKYLPNGQALKGSGRQGADSAPNFDARCTASPYDPNSPNVRGEQNVPRR
ncbi:MlaD family protein [Nocardioides sp. LML1-1-1.1]|uniref:MlaD family protein n=1 Tax=Nocardioides sp. LML1-1-1.1 TaxID=3135248 RepID=UPI00342C211F